MYIEIEEGGDFTDFKGPCLKITAETKLESFKLGILFNDVIEKHNVDAKGAFQENVYIKIPIVVEKEKL